MALSITVIEELNAWRLRQAQEMLRLGVRPDGDTFVVTQADGSPLQPRSLTHEWVRVLSTTKLPRIRFHDLRHAHATHMLASGVHPKVASERLGHSKVGPWTYIPTSCRGCRMMRWRRWTRHCGPPSASRKGQSILFVGSIPDTFQ